MTIRFFSKSERYREFSNFANYPIEIEGTVWPTSEHYYQAHKFDDPDLRERARHMPNAAAVKRFAGKYRAAYGEDAGPYSSYGYTMGKVFAEALKSAGSSDRAAIVAALKQTDYDSIIGKIKFDDKGALIDPVLYLYQVQDGAFKLIGDSSK